MALEAVKPKLETVLSALVTEIESRIEMYDFDITALAVDGHRSLPVEKLCAGNLDEVIKDRVLAHFK